MTPTFQHAIERRIVRLPNGDQAELTFVNRNRTRAKARALSTGRWWRGRPDVLELVDLEPVGTPA